MKNIHRNLLENITKYKEQQYMASYIYIYIDLRCIKFFNLFSKLEKA